MLRKNRVGMKNETTREELALTIIEAVTIAAESAQLKKCHAKYVRVVIRNWRGSFNSFAI